MDTARFWIDNANLKAVKLESHLNFSRVPSEEESDDFNYKKKEHQLSRDPMSHRIIEKRRRDRMNNCLADLSRLIPTDYLKKGRGRIEKTEIIEMAIKHMKHLQDVNSSVKTDSSDTSQPPSQDEAFEHNTSSQTPIDHYRLGYQECMAEAMHFMTDIEGFFAGDQICIELINHLQKNCDKATYNRDQVFPLAPLVTESANTFSGSVNFSQHNTTVSSGSTNSTSSSAGDSQPDYIKNEITMENIIHKSKDGSHLRNMLSCPDLSASNNRPNTHVDPLSYKFKNNIKQRFSAEHGDGLKRRRFDVTELKRRNCDSCTISSPFPSPVLPSTLPPKPVGVPIFALHAKGLFYVPLTINSEDLSQFYEQLNGDVGQALHPITISVCFPQPTQSRVVHIISRRNSMKEEGGYLPLTAWKMYQANNADTFVNKRLQL